MEQKQSWYIEEIGMHCAGARLNYSALLELVNNQNLRQTRLVWFRLNSFLMHCAMISKYLSPISRSAKQRGEELCELLEVDDPSPILYRKTRDNVEHFDERIDTWKSGESILEIVFDDRSGLEQFTAPRWRIRRVLIQDEKVYVTEDRDGNRVEISLEPLFEETERLTGLVNKLFERDDPYIRIYPQAQT